MKIKSILVLVATVAIVAFTFTQVSFAQEKAKDGKQCDCKEGHQGKHHKHKHGKKGMKGQEFGPARMYKDLDLTPDQEKKANEIFKNAREKGANVVTEAQKQQMKDIRENSMKEFRAILTPEQAKKLDAKQEKMKAFMEKRKQDRGNYKVGPAKDKDLK